MKSGRTQTGIRPDSFEHAARFHGLDRRRYVAATRGSSATSCLCSLPLKPGKRRQSFLLLLEQSGVPDAGRALPPRAEGEDWRDFQDSDAGMLPIYRLFGKARDPEMIE